MDLGPFIDKLRRACSARNVELLGVFGSVARGADTPKNDVDLLVRLSKPVGFVEFITLEDTFREILGRNVDLATESSLHPLIRKTVMADLKIIYEK